MANFDFGLPKSVSFSVFYFASRPGHTVEPITTNEGSKRVFLLKEVPFGGSR